MKITKQGKHAINAFISEITAKRNEILDARRDTANETTLPNMEDIICDIPNFIDSDGDYINGWGCTDHTDLAIHLTVGEDFLVDGSDLDWLTDELLEKFKSRKERCRDCIALVADKNEEWFCDKAGIPCKYIEKCTEFGK